MMQTEEAQKRLQEKNDRINHSSQYMNDLKAQAEMKELTAVRDKYEDLSFGKSSGYQIEKQDQNRNEFFANMRKF